MCPCNPDNGEFVYARLATAPVLAGVSLVCKHWTKMIAYDFHRTMRCYSCLTIEEFSKQVIEQEFAGEIASGLLEYAETGAN